MIDIASYSFSGRRAIIRVDFNVPLDKQTLAITDDTRIRGALPTIQKVLADGGAAILMSHLGRPNGQPQERYSLRHVLPALERLLGQQVLFAPSCVGSETLQLAQGLKPRQVLLLENLRFHEEEEGKPYSLGEQASDEQRKAAKAALKVRQQQFVDALATLADCYVNDAFGTAHRAHASTAIIADRFKGNCMFGFLINNELRAMDHVLHSAQRPAIAIMGGAKVSDKIQIIENLLDRVDTLVIGGGMTYTFVKAQGGRIGSSLCEDDKLDLARQLLRKAHDKGVRVMLPTDAVNADSFSAEAQTCISSIDQTPDGWMGLDIGPATAERFAQAISQAQTILWNGPMGVFEMEPFAHGTTAIARAVAQATAHGAFSLVGGGDSVAAVNRNNLGHSISYVSTGGGAMLEYMEGKALPGIEAIRG